MGPEISIVIPTLNEEKYLTDTLSAIKCQTFRDYETIVVDSNSRDRTREIALSHGARVISCEKKGVSAARNMGIRDAKGKYIVFIDADTEIDVKMLERVRNYYRRYPSSVGAVALILPKNEHSLKPLYVIDFVPFFLNTLFVCFMNQVVKSPVGYAICMTMRKDVLEKEKFNEAFFTLEDHDLVRRVSKYGSFRMLNSIAKCSIRRNRMSLVPHRIVTPSLYPLCYLTHVSFWAINYLYYLRKHRPLFNRYPQVR